MQFKTSFALAAVSQLACAAPHPTIQNEKPSLVQRQSVTDGPVGYASMGDGTTGGAGGSTTTVSSLAEYTAAAESDDPMVIFISGTISGGATVRTGSNKSIIGLNSEATLNNVGHYVKEVSNVIFRNLVFTDVSEGEGDAIGIDASTNVWVDHCDFSSNLDNGKDFYDGLVDMSHGADWITISNSVFHDHYKASLIGHSDSNGDEDEGKLHITYANNIWSNINSRTPLLRFGTVHIFNSIYENIMSTGLNTRMGAQALVESTTFADSSEPITSRYSDEDGYAVLNDVDLGSGENNAPEGTLTSVPYEYELVGSENLEDALCDVGATMSFE